jgi:competence protein ComEA
MISDVPMNGRVGASGRDPTADMVRSVGFAAVMCICAVAGFGLAMKAASPSASPATLEIESTVNPNDASSASLARLPGIGQVRARAIVSYRRQLSQQDRPVFQGSEDLRAIPGIGPATAEAIRPWLSFDRPRDSVK